MFWDIPVCSGMFRNVAECSMFLALSTTSGLALWFLNYMNEQMRRQLNAVLHGCYHLKVSNIAKTSCEPKPVVLRWQPMHTPVSDGTCLRLHYTGMVHTRRIGPPVGVICVYPLAHCLPKSPLCSGGQERVVEEFSALSSTLLLLLR